MSSNFKTDPGSELQKYANPFGLASRDMLPLSLSDVLRLCQWLYLSNPQMRMAVRRMVGHAVTNLRFRGKAGSPEERARFAEAFKEKIKGFRALRRAGEDLFAYGSAFLRVYYPFNRQLVDSRYHNSRPFSLSIVPPHLVEFDLATLTYKVPDPLQRDKPWDSRPRVSFPFRDVRRKSFEGMRLLRLNPLYVKLRYSSWSDSRQVQYSFEPEMKSRIKNGDLMEINRAPRAILRAIRDQKEYLFDEDAVFCLSSDTISGVLDHGFGLPDPVSVFPTLYKMAIYDRADENISREMVEPYRVVSPTALPTDGSFDGREFRAMVNKIIASQRIDRSKIGVSPIPLNWQEVGANGKALVPKDLKDYEFQQLLRGLGIPEEFFAANLRVEALPYAVRIFEETHSDFFESLCDAAHWAVEKMSAFVYGETYDAILEPSSVADDATRRVILRDLYQAQEIPKRVLFDSLNLEDPMGLKIERGNDDLKTQEELAALEDQYRRRAELGSLNDVLMQQQEAAQETPVDVMDNASSLAMQWLGMPVGQRQQAMRAVAAQNRQLYLMAKDIMDTERAKGEAAGRDMVYQQAAQQ